MMVASPGPEPKAFILATNSDAGMPAIVGISPWLRPSVPWQAAHAFARAAGARSAAPAVAPWSDVTRTIGTSAEDRIGRGGAAFRFRHPTGSGPAQVVVLQRQRADAPAGRRED